MNWLQDWVWGAPQWLPAAAIIAAVLTALTIANYVRASGHPAIRGLAAAFKLAAVALLAVCLLQPMRRGSRPVPQANLFPILVDNSHSMQLRHTETTLTRGEAVARLVAPEQTWRQRLAQDFDVRSYRFDRQLQSADAIESLDYTGWGSSIGGSLEQLAQRLAGRPVAGVLLISDGNATETDWLADNTRRWKQLGFPVYPVVPASTHPPADLRVADVTVTHSDFETAPVTARVTIAATGLTGKTAIVQLVDQENDAVVQQQTVDLVTSDDGLQPPLTFRFRPLQAGVRFYRVQTFQSDEQASWDSDTNPGSEATYANNTRLLTVQVPSGPYRVLYLAGRPNWEFKFLQRAIQADPETDLVGLLRIADKEAKFSFRDRKVSDVNPLFAGAEESDDETAQRYDEAVLLRLGVDDAAELQRGFPRLAEDLFRYHAIILDDIETDFFTQDQLLLIRQFVANRGGGLLLLGGSEAFSGRSWADSPLAELAPVYAAHDRPTTGLASPPPQWGGSPTGFDPHDKPFRFELTREGLVQPWLRLREHEQAERQRLQQMPALQPLSPVGSIKPGATVLAVVRTVDDETFPALISQRFGKGRSAAMPITDLWRWSMRRPTAQENDETLVRDDPGQAWRQIVRWLVNESPQPVQCHVQPSDDPSQPAEVIVTVLDEAYRPLENAQVQLTIHPPEGEPYPATATADFQNPGQYRYQHWQQQTGGYRASIRAVAADDGSEIGTAEIGWISDPTAAEFRRLTIDRQRLAQLATASGGELVEDDSLAAFVNSLSSREMPVSQTWVYPIWHRPWVMCLAIVCLCTEWGLRRWKGMP